MSSLKMTLHQLHEPTSRPHAAHPRRTVAPGRDAARHGAAGSLRPFRRCTVVVPGGRWRSLRALVLVTGSDVAQRTPRDRKVAIMERAKIQRASCGRRRGIWFAALGPVAALLVAGDCSSYPESPPNPNRGAGWVKIDRESETASVPRIGLNGSAFISRRYWRCCTGSATDTGVTVTWSNVTTGASGPATQKASYCWFLQYFLCEHTWSALIDLEPGPNEIRVEAQDPGGDYGISAVMIRRVPAVTIEEVYEAEGRCGLRRLRWGPGALTTRPRSCRAETYSLQAVLTAQVRSRPRTYTIPDWGCGCRQRQWRRLGFSTRPRYCRAERRWSWAATATATRPRRSTTRQRERGPPRQRWRSREAATPRR